MARTGSTPGANRQPGISARPCMSRRATPRRSLACCGTSTRAWAIRRGSTWWMSAPAGPNCSGRCSPAPPRNRGWPAGLDPRIRWCASPPPAITGLVVASEWLDNIPLDVVELTAAGPAVIEVDPATGAERPGCPPDPADLAWLRDWWPLAECGDRAEVGRTRCAAWAEVIRRIDRGVAVAADYGHRKAARPARGTLIGYLEGWAVPALPDGSRDITAHVALDACATAGTAAGASESVLIT